MNLLQTDLAIRAAEFAQKAHLSAGQIRKYTGEPYFVHPKSVATTVSLVVGATMSMVAAAYLHDVVEDCDIELDVIKREFGPAVASYVDDLTKRDHLHPEWPRAMRKVYEAGRLSRVSVGSATIKLADLIDNTSTIIPYDRKFARTYLLEKQLLVTESLIHGDPLLLKIAREQVTAGLRTIDSWEKELAGQQLPRVA
jgi:guanosine-3',5'-bis(diphosphate) 3'-pyrophosphohydrolase